MGVVMDVNGADNDVDNGMDERVDEGADNGSDKGVDKRVVNGVETEAIPLDVSESQGSETRWKGTSRGDLGYR